MTVKEETMIEDMARMIQEEIDWEIMCNMMKGLGWIQIEVKQYDVMHEVRMTESLAHEIKEWCRNNLTGMYRARGRTWMFANDKDAVLFSLKWA